MSVRVYTLAKQLGIESKDLLALLRARHAVSPQARSVSCTVPNITASAIRDEFDRRQAPFAALDALARLELADLPTPKKLKSYTSRMVQSSPWHGKRKIRRALDPHIPEIHPL